MELTQINGLTLDHFPDVRKMVEISSCARREVDNVILNNLQDNLR